LNEKCQRLDLQIAFITKQIESCDQKIQAQEKEKILVEEKHSKKDSTSRSVKFYSVKDFKREETSPQNKEILTDIKYKLLNLIRVVKNSCSTLNKVLNPADGMTTMPLDDIVKALNKDKPEMRLFDLGIEKLGACMEYFNKKLDNVVEWRLSETEEENMKLEYVQNQIAQKNQELANMAGYFNRVEYLF
jgi:hypothetical protein